MNKLVLIVSLFVTGVIILWSLPVKCEPRLVIPTYTQHIIVQGDYKYNEHNPGLGIENHTESYTVGYAYARNSYYLNSHYAYVTVPIVSSNLRVGLLVATNYIKDIPTEETGVLVTPVLSWEYKYLRIVSSYPMAKVIMPKDKYTNISDIVNVQLVIPF